ncbi:hypothetical protein CNMCM5793_006018 [Aspergillus hiratsukae]|uniref:Uncharacterized protein n=1 Tax=Aspergillus hiratsukae TaxID=1194566 RepID=A0A8H6UJW2_9EURO|nr:hypothetical protein CNMCM5793_006018 [Aspergillus hiratsukae]
MSPTKALSKIELLMITGSTTARQWGQTSALNATSFLAKLASTRVANDRLCQIVLILFRATFEAESPHGSSHDPDGEEEDPRRTLPALTIASLLPSACAWIQEAGHNIILLSESELGQRAPGGLSPWRWLYWLKRLHQIADEAAEEQAAKAIDIMLSNVKERNSQILRVSEAAGDAANQDKDFLGLKKIW